MEILSALSLKRLNNHRFYSVNIVVLYTNLSIDNCVNPVIELAEEHYDNLRKLGTIRDN